jgi:hypothetical protein
MSMVKIGNRPIGDDPPCFIVPRSASITMATSILPSDDQCSCCGRM